MSIDDRDKIEVNIDDTGEKQLLITTPVVKAEKPLKPLEFMDKFFNYYTKLFPKREDNSIFLNLKQEDLLKPDSIIEFSQHNGLSHRLYNKGVTALAQKGDIMLTGDIKGYFHILRYNQGIETKNFPITNVDGFSKLSEKLKEIKSIDISPSGNLCICGYKAGCCILWDLKEEKFFYCIKDTTIQGSYNPIINCKFITETEQGKRFEIIKTHENGQVIKTTLTLVFNKKGDKFDIKESNEIIFEEKTTSPFFITEIFKQKVKTDKSIELSIVAIGNYNQIYIYVLSPFIQLVKELNRGGEVSKGPPTAPDISFGYGIEPLINIEELALKNSSNRKVMIAINWENTLRIYSLQLVNKFAQLDLSVSEKASCHFINPMYKIIRLGFIANSFLYIIDDSKTLKVLNTACLIPGGEKPENLSILEEEELYKQCIVGERKLNDETILYDTYELEHTFCGGTIHSYRGFAFTEGNIIHFLATKSVFAAKVYNYEEYLNNLSVEGKWSLALQVGIGIYQNKISNLAGVSMKDPVSKGLFICFLKNLVISYVSYGITDEDKDSATYNIIDFCLTLNETTFLFSELLTLYNSNGRLETFFAQLESFILQGKLKEELIDEAAMVSFIGNYVGPDKKMILTLLLNNINPECLEYESVKSMCKKYDLFQAWFNFANSKERIEVLQKMFLKFQERTPVDAGEKVIYMDLIQEKGIEYVGKMKEFLGHQILYDLNKMIYTLDFEEEEDKIIIAILHIWILSSDKYQEFCNFDSFSYFEILYQFFLNRSVLASVQTVDYTNLDVIKAIANFPGFITFKNLFYGNTTQVIQYLVEASENIVSFYHSLDNNIFLLKISSLYIRKRSLANAFYKACDNIITLEIDFRKQPKNELFDKFECHNFCPDYIYLINTEFIESITERLMIFAAEFPFDDFADELKINCKNEEPLEAMIHSAQNSPYLRVLIRLLERQGSYDDCINIFIKNSDQFSKDFIFTWIEEKLTQLKKEQDKTKYNLLYDKILNILDVLANLSIEDVRDLISRFFKEEKRITIIRKLGSSKNTQLEYIEKLLKSYIKASKFTFSENEQIDDDEFNEVLKLHIDLLIELNKKKDILKWLQKPLPYPFDMILSTLIQYEVIDSAVYVFQRLGNNEAGLNYILKHLQSIFERITKEKAAVQETIDEFSENFDRCISICQNNCEQTETFDTQDTLTKANALKIQNDNEKLWFDVFQKLYNFLGDVKSDDKVEPELRTYTPAFREKISEHFQNFFKKMCKYVRVLKVMDSSNQLTNLIEYGEFKHSLIEMINGTSLFQNILKKGKIVFHGNVLINFWDLAKTNLQGAKYVCNKCDYCRKRFSTGIDDEAITVFRCGHKIHVKCTQRNKNGDIFCQICKQIEMESIVIEQEEVEQKHVDEDENEFIGFRLGSKVSKIKKLSEFDSRFSELHKLLEI